MRNTQDWHASDPEDSLPATLASLAPLQPGLRLDRDPDFRPLFGSPRDHLQELPAKVRQLLDGSSPTMFLKVSQSRGRPHRLPEDQGAWIDRCIQSVLKAGIVRTARRGSFISFPFLVAKADATPRLIIDYSHLRSKYIKPHLCLPAVIQ